MLTAKLEAILPHLDERQRRLLLGAEARGLGHGGIRAVAKAAGVREATVSRGVDELDAGAEPLGRARRPGGGRKRLVETDPELRAALLRLVEPDERGDPASPLRWTTKSTRKLAGELTERGHKVSADTVADILRGEGFSLQANAKTLEGAQHPDRDAQFRYLNEQVRAHRDTGQPVISVDTKKKELIGEFKNAGRQWRPAGEPVPVNVYDFAASAAGKAIPYGIYDIAANTGWVNVGTDHDTATFAVASIRRWWHAQGRGTYPQATRLLITADAGGANSYRTRSWKGELARLAAETGLAITVCHLPPGTSKWNKVEHRLFAHITMNWRGRPLTSHEVVINSIAATTTSSGLRVQAALDTGTYPLGARVSDADLAALPLTRHVFHGDWNYTLHPALDGDPDSTEEDQPPERWHPQILSDPALTGMPRPALDRLTADLHALDQQRPRIKPGRPSTVTFSDQVLLTVLHQRLGLAFEPLAVLFATSRTTAYRAIRSIGELLDQDGSQIAPAPTPPGLLRILHARVLAEDTKAANKIKPAC
nr:ISAzo13 family transposase [Nonomuraea guangzhouensis]